MFGTLIVFQATNTIPAFMQADAYQLVLRSQTEFNTEFHVTALSKERVQVADRDNL
jgi:hypothetical protein